MMKVHKNYIQSDKLKALLTELHEFHFRSVNVLQKQNKKKIYKYIYFFFSSLLNALIEEHGGLVV